MKKANEMRVIAEAKVEAMLQERREKAANLVENTIASLVSAAATMGQSSTPRSHTAALATRLYVYSTIWMLSAKP